MVPTNILYSLLNKTFPTFCVIVKVRSRYTYQKKKVSSKYYV